MQGEYWYGGSVHSGVKQPIGVEDVFEVDLRSNLSPNQAVPFFVSNKGRYLWSDEGFNIKFSKGQIMITGDVTLEEGLGTLKNAYLDAKDKYFPFKNISINNALFAKPIYNSWIELTFHQNENDILKYAGDIIGNGLPAGVLMIDDGWSDYYGKWTFNLEKFPNPQEMITKLRKQGFNVMLWICPFITPDTFEYRQTKALDLLIKTPEGKPFITEWWNGYSAVLDMSNPKAAKWLEEQLNVLQEMGIDGFKFDAGDSLYYREDNVTFEDVNPNEQSRLWAEFGAKYEFNEYRVTFKAGGYSLMQRLCDKHHSWDESGIEALIPNSLVQGITGHPFSCPDMIGGGEYMNFYDMEEGALDPELFNRHSEIACLMPSMQFSAAPWRILSSERFELIKKSVALRGVYEEEILELVDLAKETGEPIMRYMEYEFPNEEMAQITDQFMLGETLLVAPIHKKGEIKRQVYIPKGTWLYQEEKITSQGSYHELTPSEGEPIVLKKV